MASVAADPSAIAPPLPLPARSDAAQPAGPSSAFADLLDAAAPASAPQNGSTSRADDGSNTAQAGAAPGSTTGSADPAGAGAATSGSHTAKNAGAKGSDDQTTPINNGTAASNAAANVTLVAGVPLLPFALAPLPNPDQTPATPQNAQGASADPVQATGSDPTGQQGNRKDASASPDCAPTSLVAGLPGLVAITAAAAPAVDASPRVSTGPVAPVPLNAPIEVVLSGPNMSAPSADPDPRNGPAPLTPGEPGQPSLKAPVAAQDVLPATPVIASELPPAYESQTAALPPPLQATAGAASDQTGRSAAAAAPVTMPVAPSSALTPGAAAAPLNPVPPTPFSAEIHVADQPGGNMAAPREAESIPLPLQVAVRFAASFHANNADTSDTGTGGLLGFAGGSIGASTPTSGDGQTGAATPPSFNPAVPTAMQAASAQVIAPQHIAVLSNAVPLAGIPIAIVARAEAGEKKFEIRLDPPDLGRIEVQLNVDSSGRATSHLIVDRADTLDLLRRDAPALERALQSAGLTTDEGALQFSLRDQSFAGREQGAPAPFTPATPAAAEGDLAPIDTAMRRYGAPMGLGGGIDIRV